MENATDSAWIDGVKETLASYRRMIDATIEQLSDAELRACPAPGINSVAVILRHLGGNLRSRWTDFLTTDGEKPDRNRDSEFLDWNGDRRSLMVHFDAGWEALTTAIRQMDSPNINQPIFIRGERHTIPHALARSITHLSYHVGQIAMVARMVHQGEWRWLTIPPGGSAHHNEHTWGTTASRGVFGDVNDPDTGSIAGMWFAVWSMWDATPTPADDLRDVTLTFAQGRCEVYRGGKLIRRGTYTSDTTQTPQTLDVCFTESDVPELIDAPLRGICEVHGERLRICYGPPGGERASSFAAEKGTGHYLAEYRRCDHAG